MCWQIEQVSSISSGFASEETYSPDILYFNQKLCNNGDNECETGYPIIQTLEFWFTVIVKVFLL